MDAACGGRVRASMMDAACEGRVIASMMDAACGGRVIASIDGCSMWRESQSKDRWMQHVEGE